ncbi:hypothetical protein pb186bvf_019646 [Paramecium bursaria]
MIIFLLYAVSAIQLHLEDDDEGGFVPGRVSTSTSTSDIQQKCEQYAQQNFQQACNTNSSWKGIDSVQKQLVAGSLYYINANVENNGQIEKYQIVIWVKPEAGLNMQVKECNKLSF